MGPLVLYHGGGCADGFCAAWICHTAMVDAECIPVNYGEDPPNAAILSGRQVYIVDFSYKRAVLDEMRQSANQIIILDHHKTAQEELIGGYEVENGFRLILNSVRVKFDMSKSGGRMTWEHFFPDEFPPWLVDYTEDRDLWTWKMWKSKEINAALASYPRDFETWDKLAGYAPSTLATEGAAILRYQCQQVDNQCKNAVEIEMDGHKVLSLNATLLISEIAGKLAENRPFGATWFQRSDGNKVWSLRSREGGIDVSEIAKRHGGGGHKQAAGFTE